MKLLKPARGFAGAMVCGLAMRGRLQGDRESEQQEQAYHAKSSSLTMATSP
jgi:hypothetical protein